MTSTTPAILARIVAKKQEELACLFANRDELERAAEKMRPQRREFTGALSARAPAIIAEVKRASPSKGVLAADFDPARRAQQYEAGGAAALSVLTDEPFFQGKLDDLRKARASVGLPVLRKDFTLHEVHVLEAAAHGADAVLLIAAILEEKQLRDLRELASALGLAALVEVHNSDELEKAKAAGADLIGVNNRDLNTFEVSLETSLRLAERLPERAVKVSESGIGSADDVWRLRRAGYTAFLVGEHLMNADDPARALRALLAGP